MLSISAFTVRICVDMLLEIHFTILNVSLVVSLGEPIEVLYKPI